MGITAIALSTATLLTSGLVFDDFSQTDLAGLRASGWTVREAAGHPGITGARWGEAGLELRADAARPGQRVLRLQAETDGTPGGTRQAQVCHRRQLLQGTYAARVRFTDRPVRGADGDPVIQAFYAISPLAHDFDPQFSEVDFEYLPNGGWGSPTTRLYAIAWQTVRIEPWQAHNSAHETPGSFDGWRELTIQVSKNEVRHHVDSRLVARHGGRHVPVQPMSLNLSLWFSPGGLLPASPGAPRQWIIDVDWVFHAAGVQLDPAAVRQHVQALRAAGTSALDTVRGAGPALPTPCDV
jgi:hypothetical protein